MVLVTVLTLLAGAVLYGAYGYLPAEAGRSYQPQDCPEQVNSLLADFLRDGRGP